MSEMILVRRRDSLESDEVSDECAMMVSRPNGYPWSQADEILLNEGDKSVIRLKDGEYAVRLPSIDTDWDVLPSLPDRFADLEDDND